MVPPRVVADLIRNPLSVFLAVRSVANTCRIPPDVSLPSVTNPAPLLARHFLITIYSAGLFTRNPSQSRPAFKQKLSSLQSISQFWINIQLEESTSTPSVLGPWPSSLFLM